MQFPMITPDTAAIICDIVQKRGDCNNIDDCKDCPFIGPEELKDFIQKSNKEAHE